MKTSTRRALAEIIKTSLNADQANYIAGHVDPVFNIHEISGFGKNLAIPPQVAAETVVGYFGREEDLVRFFEVMIDRQGTFVHGSTISIKGKNDFIKLLRDRRWIYDPDLELFFRDPFYLESENLLKSIELIDLRVRHEPDEILATIGAAAERLQAIDLDWSVTLRTYRIGPAVDRIIRAVLDMLLSRQQLQEHAYPLYCCLRELAVNAGKANYKYVYRLSRASATSGDEARDAAAFRDELEQHGDENLEREARKRDVYFDIVFRSTERTVSLWAWNFIPLLTAEKQRILSKLKVKDFGADSFGGADEFAEGAGLGLNLVKKILKPYHAGKDPVSVVFYPGQTKIGFVLRRENMRSEAARAAAEGGGLT